MNKGTKKKLSKKMNLKARLATVGLVGGLAAASLVGCNDVEAIKDPVEITSEVEDESIVSEEPTEEESIVSEEPVEEVETCIADDIINLYDKLSKKYENVLTPEQVLSLIVVANYDYMTEEELENLFNSIELSADDINNIYYDTMRQFVDIQKNYLACVNAAVYADYDMYYFYDTNQIKSSDFVIINEYENATDFIDNRWKDLHYSGGAEGTEPLIIEKLESDSNFGNSLNYILNFYLTIIHNDGIFDKYYKEVDVNTKQMTK